MFKKYKEIFRSKDLFKILIASSFSNFGDWMQNTALLVYFTNLDRLDIYAALTTIRVVLMLVFMPIISNFLDKMNSKYILLFSDILRFAITMILGLLIYFNLDSINLILITSVLNIILGLMFLPVHKSLILNFAKNENINTFNSLEASSSNLMLILAPSLTGILLIYFTISTAIFVNAITFLISFILIANLADNCFSKKNMLDEANPLTTFFGESLAGFKHILNSKLLFTNCTTGFVFSFGVGSVWIFISAVVNSLKLTNSFIGYYTSVVGIGSILGSLVGGKAENSSLLHYIQISSLFFGVCFVIWPHSIDSIFFSMFIVFLISFFGCLSEPASISILHNNTDPSVFSRTFSSFDTVSMLGLCLGSNISALLLKKVSLKTSLLTVSFTISTLFLIILLNHKKNYFNIQFNRR